MILSYVYKLIHKQTNEFYFGMRFGNIRLNRKSEDDLGIHYQSSSNLVKLRGFENFDYYILAEFFEVSDAFNFEQELIKEHLKHPLCLNQYVAFNNETMFHYTNAGKTKENDPGILKMSKNLSGRTKETHESVAKTWRKMKGRKRPNISKHLKGRTKETHEYIRTANEKKQGRNKNNYESFAKMARSFCILSEDEELKLYELRNQGLPRKEVAAYFDNRIAIQTVSTIYYRIKNQLETFS